MRIHHQFEIFTWRAVHLEINSGGLAELDANRLVYLCVFVNVSCAHALRTPTYVQACTGISSMDEFDSQIQNKKASYRKAHTHTHTHRRRMTHTHTPSQTRTHMHALDHAGLTAPQYYCPEREHARAREEHLERHGHAQAHRLAVTHLITQSPQLLIILLQCQPAHAHATSLDVSPHLVQSDRPPFMYVCMHVRMFVCIVRTYVFEMCSLSIYVCI